MWQNWHIISRLLSPIATEIEIFLLNCVIINIPTSSNLVCSDINLSMSILPALLRSRCSTSTKSTISPPMIDLWSPEPVFYCPEYHPEGI
jgi:hypothetical protein